MYQKHDTGHISELRPASINILTGRFRFQINTCFWHYQNTQSLKYHYTKFVFLKTFIYIYIIYFASRSAISKGTRK